MTSHDLATRLLDQLEAATWPDGSPLIDVDRAVLQTRLHPQLVEVLDEQ